MNTIHNLDFKADPLPYGVVKKCEPSINGFSHLKYIFLHSVGRLTRRLELITVAATPPTRPLQSSVGWTALLSPCVRRHGTGQTPTGMRAELVWLGAGSTLDLQPPEARLVPRSRLRNGASSRVLPLPSVSTDTFSSVLGSVAATGPDALPALVSFKVCVASRTTWDSLWLFKTQLSSLGKLKHRVFHIVPDRHPAEWTTYTPDSLGQALGY